MGNRYHCHTDSKFHCIQCYRWETRTAVTPVGGVRPVRNALKVIASVLDTSPSSLAHFAVSTKQVVCVCVCLCVCVCVCVCVCDREIER